MAPGWRPYVIDLDREPLERAPHLTLPAVSSTSWQYDCCSSKLSACNVKHRQKIDRPNPAAVKARQSRVSLQHLVTNLLVRDLSKTVVETLTELRLPQYPQPDC